MLPPLRYGVGSLQGRRKSMEDRHALVEGVAGPGTWFAGVFDGHNGDGAAAFLEANLASAVKEAIAKEGVNAEVEVITHACAIVSTP